MTKGELTALCILPEETLVRADWSAIGCPIISERRLSACLLAVWQYDNGHPVPLPPASWDTAKDRYIINLDASFSFDYVVSIINRIVGKQSGLFVYSGDVDLQSIEDQFTNSDFLKICKPAFSTTALAASCSEDIDKLRGFDPMDDPLASFYLGWFPQSDPLGEVIAKRWLDWLDDEACTPFVPKGPSPSKQSVEVTFYGEENDGIGLYLSETFPISCPTEWFRELLGESALIARLRHRRLPPDWFYKGSLNDIEII